ncbi:MAG: acetyl-CoA carboxylase, carboxyltransferase subunit beta [Solirubrobacterales bacterium]
MNNIFKKKYITVSKTPIKKDVNVENKPSIPGGLWVKCDKCGQIIYKEDLENNLKVCPYCNHHFRMSARERVEFLTDSDTFIEFDENMQSVNPLDFEGYEEKIKILMQKTGLNEAVVTGKCSIYGQESVLCVMDSFFMMGSMGSVVGEKIVRAVEKAIELKLPVIIFTTSGGARMQEGMYSLMQMAKTSAALGKLSDAGLLYVTVLTDPTTGGVTASFASLGDIILAEPGALVGFAGRRVIEETIRKKLPDDFQSAEFLIEHGFIDKIVHRKELKSMLKNILFIHRDRR